MMIKSTLMKERRSAPMPCSFTAPVRPAIKRRARRAIQMRAAMRITIMVRGLWHSTDGEASLFGGTLHV